MEYPEFQNKTAIVTGAASGMGLLFAENFVALGGNAVMCDVSEETLLEKCAAINEKYPDRATAVLCDVRDYRQVCRAVETAVQTYGSIDITASFAGGSAVRVQKVDGEKYPEFPDVPIEVYDWGIDVNLKGPFYLAHAALGHMRKQGSGLIVNIGSISGVEGDGFGVEYPTAKSGLMYGFTRSVAQYGAKYGIRCVCISPGPVLTRAAMAKMRTMLGRAAEPQEIVDLVLYVASEKGRFINGENILIDGGRNALPRLRYQ